MKRATAPLASVGALKRAAGAALCAAVIVGAAGCFPTGPRGAVYADLNDLAHTYDACARSIGADAPRCRALAAQIHTLTVRTGAVPASSSDPP